MNQMRPPKNPPLSTSNKAIQRMIKEKEQEHLQQQQTFDDRACAKNPTR